MEMLVPGQLIAKLGQNTKQVKSYTYLAVHIEGLIKRQVFVPESISIYIFSVNLECFGACKNIMLIFFTEQFEPVLIWHLLVW